MRVLVTGGAGFIGSHLAEGLVAAGHDVVAFDNLSTGRRENVPAAAEFVTGDVARLGQLERAFAGGLDAVCHVAGQVSLIRSFTDPVVDLRTNVEGTVNVLQLCLRHGVRRMLYASSMTVYGSTERLPTPEREPCWPISYYGITKLAGERYVHTTADRVDLDAEFNVTSFRMYNVYGPRQALDNPYQGVLGIFIGNVLRGEPLTIFGDGHQSRDFVYVGDVVDAWVSALEHPATFGRVFNLGSGQRMSIGALAERVVAAVGGDGSGPRVVRRPARSGEQRHVEADPSAALAAFGWAPQVPFDTGLEETIRWSSSSTPARTLL
jgi:UDP-glucose 4-epimerase